MPPPGEDRTTNRHARRWCVLVCRFSARIGPEVGTCGSAGFGVPRFGVDRTVSWHAWRWCGWCADLRRGLSRRSAHDEAPVWFALSAGSCPDVYCPPRPGCRAVVRSGPGVGACGGAGFGVPSFGGGWARCRHVRRWWFWSAALWSGRPESGAVLPGPSTPTRASIPTGDRPVLEVARGGAVGRVTGWGSAAGDPLCAVENVLSAPD